MEGTTITLKELFKTALNAVASPAAFFRALPRTGGFTAPFVFLVAMGAVTGLVTALLGLLDLANIFSTGMAFAAVLIIPAVYAVMGFVLALLAHLVWKAFGSGETYETSYRCIAYIGAFMPVVAVLNVIPYLGWMLVAVLVTYVYVVATVEVHRIPPRTAWAVFGAIGLAVLFLGLGRESGMRTAERASAQRIEQMQKELNEMRSEREAR